MAGIAICVYYLVTYLRSILNLYNKFTLLTKRFRLSMTQHRVYINRIFSNYQTGHKLDILSHGYVRKMKDIEIPTEIINIIKQFYMKTRKIMRFDYSDLKYFDIFADGTIIKAKNKNNSLKQIYKVYSQSLMDPNCNGVHYFSINTLNTPSDAFAFIGCESQFKVVSFDPKANLGNGWKGYQKLTVKLDYPRKKISFFVGNLCYGLKSIEKPVPHRFVVGIKASLDSMVQIVDTPNVILQT